MNKIKQEICEELYPIINNTVKDRFVPIFASLTSLKARNKKQDAQLEEILQKVDEMHEIFTGVRFVNKAFKYLLWLIGAVAGTYLLIRELFKKS